MVRANNSERHQVVTTLRDNTSTYVQNTFDAYGNEAGVDNYVGVPGGTPAPTRVLSTSRPYVQDAWDNVFLPQYEAKTDPLNSSQLMSCTRFYYDGATSAGVLATSGAHGLLTAKSTKAATDANPCNATAVFPANGSTNTYLAYDQYARPVAASVATTVVPETFAPTPPPPPPNVPSSSYGWVATGVGYAKTTFDPTYNLFPYQQTTPSDGSTAAQTTTTTYNPTFGKPDTVTVATGYATKMSYDTFGRLTQVADNYNPNAPTTPLVSPTAVLHVYAYAWGAVPNRTIVQDVVQDGSTAARTTVACLDGFGREVEHRQSYLDTASGTLFNSVRTDYDARGMKIVQTHAVASGALNGQIVNPAKPFASFACETNPAPAAARDRTTYQYDPFGNVTTTTFLAANQTAGPSSIETYGGLTTTACDEKFNETIQVRNLAARTLTVEAPATAPGASCAAPGSSYNTTYTYDALGRLIQVADASAPVNFTHLSYDLAGRKVDMVDPDMGHWTYAYDASANLKTQTDARGVVTTLGYDVLNRLTSKSYSGVTPPGGAVPVSFQYDQQTTDGPCPQAQLARGHSAKMGDGAGNAWPCYDLRGRAMQTRRTVGATNYDVFRTYDALGDVATLRYPDNETVTYNYGGDTGALTSASSSLGGTPLVSQAYLTPWLAPGGLTLGNGETTRYTYDYRGRVSDIQTGTMASAANDQHLVLTYDDASNVASVTDKLTAEVAGYGYDQLNRLTSMTVNSAPAASYGYTSINNMRTKQEGLGGANALTLAYSTSVQGGPAHAPYAVTGLNLAYDANGNLCATSASALSSGCGTVGANGYAFDAENHLTSRSDVAGGADTYVYDGGGTLLKRTMRDLSYTIYVGGVFEENHASGGAVTGVTKYYQALGRTIAMRSSGISACASTACYALADHLGSTVGMMDSAGNVLSTQKYWPYGAVRTGSLAQTDKLYTGQQQEQGDALLGLYNYKARFYSTVTGRFVSADSETSGVNPRGLNRYAYAYDSPLGYVDPSGHDPTQSDITSCASNLEACLAWTYGISQNGFVIVMGLGEGIRGGDLGNAGDYAAYGEEFLKRYNAGCSGREAECWSAATALAQSQGADAAYDVFGIMFIESDPRGEVAPGLRKAAAGGGGGRDALNSIMSDPRGKRLRGVLGESLGAITVADYYADPANADSKTPFFLEQAPDIYIHVCPGVPGLCHEIVLYELRVNPAVEAHPRWAGTTSFFDGAGCKTQLSHCVNSSREEVADIFDRLAAKDGGP